MPLLLASAICKHDENSHQEFMRKEINQLIKIFSNNFETFSLILRFLIGFLRLVYATVLVARHLVTYPSVVQ